MYAEIEFSELPTEIQENIITKTKETMNDATTPFDASDRQSVNIIKSMGIITINGDNDELLGFIKGVANSALRESLKSGEYTETTREQYLTNGITIRKP